MPVRKARLGSDLERVRWCCLRGQLDDLGAVRIQPQLPYEPAPESLRLDLQLERRDRPEHGELVELESVGCVGGIERSLPLREELADRARAAGNLPDLAVVRRALNDAEHTNPPGIASTSTLKVLERRVFGKLGGHDRAELDDRIGLLALPTPGPNDDSGAVEREVWGSKKKTCRICASSGSTPKAAAVPARAPLQAV